MQSTRHSHEPATPTRTLVETSVGVREAARNLTKLSIAWEKPRKIMLVMKPDDRLVPKARELADYFVGKNANAADDASHLSPTIEALSLQCDEDSILNTTRNYPLSSFTCSGHSASLESVIRKRAFSLQSLITLYVQDTVLHHPDFRVSTLKEHICIRSWNAESLRKRSLAPCMTPVFKTGDDDDDDDETATSGNKEVQEMMDDISPEDVDFIITLGGDGTVLFASWIFQNIVPPILPFNLGSLGFLTVFEFGEFAQVLDKLLHRSPSSIASVSKHMSKEGLRLSLRMRFRCAVYRWSTVKRFIDDGGGCTRGPSPQSDHEEHAESVFTNITIDKTTVHHKLPEPDEVFQILNDLVVDRGPSPYMSQLEIYGDGKHLTNIQADGLVVATPTGSTAYSLSAGGATVHPEVPAILLTPICAHTLSFRPMLLPDSMELKLAVPLDSRNGAWASFDGRHRISLTQGDFILVTASKFPAPTMCKTEQTTDWFESLVRCLGWNDRRVKTQESFQWSH